MPRLWNWVHGYIATVPRLRNRVHSNIIATMPRLWNRVHSNIIARGLRILSGGVRLANVGQGIHALLHLLHTP